MIDFIISKMGMLFFVFAVASVMLFFSDSVKDLFLADESMQLSSVVVKQIKEMADTEATCVSTFVILPKYIDIFGSTGNLSYSSLFYYIDINVSEFKGGKFVVFTTTDKRLKKRLAVESFMTKAEVVFLKAGISGEQDSLSIDPTVNNTIYMIKKVSVENSELTNKLYFISCKYDEDCYGVLETLYADESIFCIPSYDPREHRENREGRE
jgi:hypothetical protein